MEILFSLGLLIFIFYKLINIIFSFIGLGFLVLIHELGHLFFCKLFNYPAPKFSIGFGPIIFKKLYKGTEYIFSILPFGGFVQVGEDTNNVDESQIEIFKKKSLYKGILVIFGGIIFNLIFSYIAIIIVNIFSPIEQKKLLISFLKNSDLLGSNFCFFEKIKEGIIITNNLIIASFNGILSLFKNKNLSNVCGILGILKTGANASNIGFFNFLTFLSISSIGLALSNLLHIPILDGGQAIMLLFSKILGNYFPKNLQKILMYSAFGLIILLTLYTTYKDIYLWLF